MKKLNLFLDFDGVILNTLGGFVGDFKALLKDLGATTESIAEFWSTPIAEVPEWKSRAYYVIENQHLLQEAFGISDLDNARLAINRLIDRMAIYLYDDAIAFIEAFPEADLFLVTTGGREWQNLKIDKSGIRRYFTGIFVTDGAKKVDGIRGFLESGIIDEAEGYFIDDRGKEIDRMKKGFPGIKTIVVRRPGSRYNSEVCEFCDEVVSDLTEAKILIKLQQGKENF